MFGSLVGVRAELAGLAAGFDPGVLSAAECVGVVREAAVIEKVAAHVKALAAARVAETGLWRERGCRSAEEDLARQTGTSVSRAREVLQTAERVRSQPAVDAAARAGRLSPEQTSVIADAVAADPEAEGRLVGGAARQSLGELRDACSRVKAAVTDLEDRQRRVHAQRAVRTFTDRDGGWNLHLRHTPEVGAAILERLRPLQDDLFAAARAEGRAEPVEAYAADALTRAVLADAAPASLSDDQPAVRVASKAAKVIVRVDWDALLRGVPLEGETCEIAGIGPVPVSVVEAMLATGDPFLAAVVTKGVDVATVAHLGRQPTAHQLTALQWAAPTCSVEGCHRATRLEVDHRHDWAATKVTLLDWLDRLCEHHHDLKTHQGWALTPGTGKRPFVAPDDSRHPRHTQSGTGATGPPGHAA